MKTPLIIFLLSITVICTAQYQFKVLLYTQHDDWHHECIPVAVESFKELATKHQFSFTWANTPQKLEKEIQHTDVLVFLNANADSLNQNQQNLIKTFMRQGGGFVGIHRASSNKGEIDWYTQLIGGSFTQHPRLQSAILHVEEADFPAVLHLPESFIWSDEWYNFSHFDKNKVNVVLSVDESSYDYTLGAGSEPMKGMGEHHPIAWYHHFDGGRVFYTALGHKPEAYKDEDFLKLLYGGIFWVAAEKRKGF